MIRLFQRGRRLLFFPTRWANAVTRWILGVHSPEGTIKVNNTAHPGEDRSIGLDVDILAVSSRVEELINAHSFPKPKREELQGLIRESLDGTSLSWHGNTFAVDNEWLERILLDVRSQLANTIPAPSNSNPSDLGDDASCGTSVAYARGDHVHKMPDITELKVATAPERDKVLTVKANTTALTWEDGGGVPTDPGSNKTTLAYSTGDASSASWQYGGINGLAVDVQTRTRWTGTKLVGYRRRFTFSKSGQLWAVSAEEEFDIDTPTKVTWS